MTHKYALAAVLALCASACLNPHDASTRPVASPLANATDAKTMDPHSNSSARAFPYDVERHRLANGLSVLFVPMPSRGLVSYWSIVRTGSRDEVEPGVTGFAHFFEHMMFRGSKRFPGPVYDGFVKRMGADANAFTTDDYTAYHLGITTQDLPTVIEIEADRFQNLEYGEAEFKTESGAVYGEYRKGRTNPFEVLFEAVQERAFDVHTYRHTTIGFEADIRRMPEQFEYSKGFFRRFYRPENVVLLVSGDFDRAATLKEIERHYGTWQPGYRAPEVAPEPEQHEARRVDVAFDGETLPIVAINFKGERLLPDDPTMIAATLIGELAFGETSPAYRDLVLDSQVADGLFSGFGYNRDPGLWTAIARVKDEADLGRVERRLWSAVAELQSKPVAQDRLDAARSRLKYSFLSDLTTPGNVNRSVAQVIAITGDIDAIDRIQATLDRVTPDDVQRAAQRWLTRERSLVATLRGKSQVQAAVPVSTSAPVLMHEPADPNVSIRIAFRAGSQDDPAGKRGLAALTAAMLGQGGTRRLAYSDVLEALFPLAASYDVSVDKELTVFSGQVHRDKLDPFYDLFLEALVSPGLRADDFTRLKASAISGIETSLRFSSDEELGKAALIERVFDGTPYAHLTEGVVADLKSITLEDVRAFLAARFTRENCEIAIGGAFPDRLPAALAMDLAALPSGKPAIASAPAPKAPVGRSVVIVDKPGDSAAISFGYPIDVRRGTREFYALWVANSWLGEHRNSSSHLYQVIREARGMNYGDYSYIEAYPNGGARTKPPTGVFRRGQMFEVWIRPVPREQTLFALRAALLEVEKLAKHGLTQEQFESTREFLSKYSLHFAETTGERLAYAQDDRFFGIGGDGHLELFRSTLAELTLEEVNAAVRKHLQADNLHIAIVADRARELRDEILADQPSPISYGDVPKPAEILAEDRVIEAYALRIPKERAWIVPVADMFSGAAPRVW